MGGGGEEHKISVISAAFLRDHLKAMDLYDVDEIEIKANGSWQEQDGTSHDSPVQFLSQHRFDVVIPCLHGFPGETGDIQPFLDLCRLPYIGCGPEASRLCFNKVSTKLWLDALSIPNSPYSFLTHQAQSRDLAENFLQQHKDIFVKSASQGSSVGCYRVLDLQSLHKCIDEAFKFSKNVLIEKTIKARELEVSVYEYGGQLHCSAPGEIVIAQNTFYDFEQKYSQSSSAKTIVKAQEISQQKLDQIKELAMKAFNSLGLRHLARVDFFLDSEQNLYLNEINTFPGLTPISMFPQMLEANGHDFKHFLKQIIDSA